MTAPANQPRAPSVRQRRARLTSVRAVAGLAPNRPHGRTPSTRAITRKASTSEIFGKMRMPNALSSETMIAATKAPKVEPRPPMTTTTNTSTMMRKSMPWLTASRGNCNAPPSAARKTPSAKTPVNSHFWLTPSAATISRSCVAARTRTPKRLRWNSSQSAPSTSGPSAIRNRS